MKFDALDRSLLASAQAERENPITTVDALAFFTGLHKMADEAVAQPQPDTTGAVEGPFLAPLPDVVQLIAMMVSNEFKTQAYYIYYANMLRGLSHEGIAEEFMEHAKDEMEHANYLLRRMGVLSPGGVSIPPYPPPEPLADPDEIVQAMIVVEQMGLSLWKQLLSMMGENPMRYTIEEFLQREEEHQDELWQLVQAPTPGAAETIAAAPGGAPAAEEAPQPGSSTQVKVETAPPKMAEIVAEVVKRKQAGAIFGRDKDPTIMGSTAQRGVASRLSEGAMPGGRPMVTHTSPIAFGLLGKRVKGYTTYDKTAATTLITQKVMALRLEADELARKEQARIETRPQTPEQLNVLAPFIVKRVDNAPKPKDVSIVPSSATDLVSKLSAAIKAAGGDPDISPEQYIMQEEQLGAQQAMAEAAHAKTIAMQSAQAAQQAQAEAQAAQQQLQETQAQLEQATQQAQQSSAQAMQATQQAAEAEGRAADHSIAKMQLGMNVNQVRQELANLVMRDPVAESAANVSDLAAQGMPATPQQQQDADAAAQQQALTGEAPQPSAETQKAQGEAERAQGDAAEQEQQAEQSAAKDESKAEGGGAGKPGTHVTVKTSGIVSGIGREAGEHMAEGALNHVRDRAAKAVGEHGGKIVAGTALGGALLAMKSHGDRVQRKGDMADAVAEGVRRAKMSGATKEVASKAKNDLSSMLERAAPHAPAFLGGLGVGVLGTRAVSGGSDSRTPAPSANFYDQYYSR